jgi:hypothetical protein
VGRKRRLSDIDGECDDDDTEANNEGEPLARFPSAARPHGDLPKVAMDRSLSPALSPALSTALLPAAAAACASESVINRRSDAENGDGLEIKLAEFSDKIRTAATQKLASALRKAERKGETHADSALMAAEAFMHGKMDIFWARLAEIDHNYTTWELCHIWARICALLCNSLTKSSAACITMAFVRAGMPLRPPFYKKRNTPNWRTPLEQSPLCAAILFPPILAHALLDLPLECGLDLDDKPYAATCTLQKVESKCPSAVPSKGASDGASDGASEGGESQPMEPEYERGPAIGQTNRPWRQTTTTALNKRWGGPVRLFERLLLRTDRAVLNAGAVFLLDGCWQSTELHTHVLIGNIFNILRCGDLVGAQVHASMDCIRVFIANAHPDGSGTDLTGGQACRKELHYETLPGSPEPSDLFPNPNSKFAGALELVERLCAWSAKQPVKNMQVIVRLEFIRSELVAALRRIHTYRTQLQPTLAVPLLAARVHAQMHAVIASYLIVPLYDESQLLHPSVVSIEPANSLPANHPSQKHNQSAAPPAPSLPRKRRRRTQS